MALTAFFFALALLKKGFTHDLLLEAGVLLVSLKLMLMTQKLGAGGNAERRLDRIQESICQVRESANK
jgi:hypothetical protein